VSSRPVDLAALSRRLAKAREEAFLASHVPAGRLLDRLRSFQRLGLNQSLFFLRQHWSHIAGEGLAQHSNPHSLKDGVLSVRVDSPLFRQELTYASGRILRIAQDHLGAEAVRSVKAARA
jgi:predicted nucleic acid-binding Zn ribbon protein